MSKTIGTLVSTIVLALLASSCTTGGVSTTPEPADLPAWIATPPWPTDRAAAADEADVLGKDFSSKSAGGTVEGDALRLTSSGGSEYAQYAFTPTGNLQDKVRIGLRQPDTQGAYVGVADYSTGRWKFYGPFTGTAEVDLDPAKHVSASNQVWIAVVVGFDGTAVIEKVQFFNPGWTEVVVDTTDSLAEPMALAAINGRPAFIYVKDTNPELTKYAFANTALGTAVQDWTTVDLPIPRYNNNYPGDIQLLDVGGHPATFIIDDALHVLYYRSSTPDGGATADWANFVDVHDQGSSGHVTSAVIDGHPATAFAEFNPQSSIVYVRSSTVDGGNASDWSNRVIVEMSPDQLDRPQLAAINGCPALTFFAHPPAAVPGVYYVRSASATGDSAADWPSAMPIYPTDNGQPFSLIELNGRPASHGLAVGATVDTYYIVGKDAGGAQWETPVFLPYVDELGALVAPGGRAAFVLATYGDGLTGSLLRASTPYGMQAADWEQVSVPAADDFPGHAVADINGKLAVAFRRPYLGVDVEVVYAVLE